MPFEGLQIAIKSGMQIKHIMTKHVESLSNKMTLAQAAEMMKQHDIGALPVCEGGRPVGMVTDRDIVIGALAQGLDPKTTLVIHAMSSPAVCCFDDQDINDAAQLMESKQIRRIVVLDRNKNIVGILTLGDLSTHAIERDLPGEILASVSRHGKLAA